MSPSTEVELVTRIYVPGIKNWISAKYTSPKIVAPPSGINVQVVLVNCALVSIV